jgi:uncharacterized membrane protein SpoIIM required for sporulation
MKQALFEARHAARWSEFETALEGRKPLGEPRAREHGGAATQYAPFPVEEFAARYRELCQHLALARDRHYGPDLVDRLNRLALAGHYALYGARSSGRNAALDFVLAGFPRLVRAEWRYVTLATLLFFGPLVALTFLVQWQPAIAYYLLAPQEIATMQSMYSSSAERLGARAADSDVLMFAYYIWNNVRIGFQTFAGGIAFGLGTLFFLLYNGTVIGAVAGFLTHAGLGQNFWSFVSGHSAMELVAIALSGAAGLRLAHGLVAPGAFSRKQALVRAAQPAVRVMIGAAAMFVIAAFIEGFWSPHRYLPPTGKYAVGIALWVLIAAYFAFAGRGNAGRGSTGAPRAA